jgi:hypothetical protein
MKYEEFAQKFEEARKKSVADNTFIFTAQQKAITQPIEDFKEVYDFIFSEDFITREVIIDDIITIEPTKQVENIFVQHII